MVILEIMSGTKIFVSCRRGVFNVSVKSSKLIFELLLVFYWMMVLLSLVYDLLLIIMLLVCSIFKSFVKCLRSERFFYFSVFVLYVLWFL